MEINNQNVFTEPWLNNSLDNEENEANLNLAKLNNSNILNFS